MSLVVLQRAPARSACPVHCSHNSSLPLFGNNHQIKKTRPHIDPDSTHQSVLSTAHMVNMSDSGHVGNPIAAATGGLAAATGGLAASSHTVQELTQAILHSVISALEGRGAGSQNARPGHGQRATNRYPQRGRRRGGSCSPTFSHLFVKNTCFLR